MALALHTNMVGRARCAVGTPQWRISTMELRTPRLILRSFREDDVDGMAQLFANPDVIGYCGFHHHPEVPGEVEIGYRLHPDYWNRGLITEAARAVRDHAFADLKLPRVISLIHPENIPSRRVGEKNRMKMEKEITFRGFPTLLYAITREEWLGLSGA